MKKYNYDDFFLLNPRISFHGGGLMNTSNLIEDAKEIDKNDSILDYGCGSGLSLMFLYKLGFNNLIGYDKNESLIKSAELRFSNEKIKPYFFYQFDEKIVNMKIDVILIESIFSFINNKELLILKKNIDKVKKLEKLKYILINDIALVKVPGFDFIEKCKHVYNIKGLRNAENIRELLTHLSDGGSLISFKENRFIYEDSPIEYPEDEQENIFLNQVINNKFSNLEEAKKYRLEHAIAINELGKEMCDNVIYFNAIIKF
jgi:SAM-dependent methyltransferase